MRLLLSQQITYPLLTRLLKSVYVRVADEEFRIEGRSPTDSRVSLLSGVHRKDVRHLRRELPREDEPPPAVTLGAQLVMRWTGLREFQDERGRPRPLSRTIRGSASPSFEDLVRSISKDIRPRSVLDEWLRLGVVHLDDTDHVCLNAAAFIPEKGFDEKAFYLGRNLRDHVAAAAHNLEGCQPPMLERSVYCGGLSGESVHKLRALAERLGMEALQAVNRLALELKREEDEAADGRRRITLGIYCFDGPSEPVGGEDDRAR